MSSMRDIVDRLVELVDAAESLLGHEEIRDAVKLAAEEIGFVDQLNAAVDGLASLLNTIREALTSIEEPLRQLDALRGLTMLLEPMLESLVNVVRNAGSQLDAVGIPIAAGAGAVADTLGTVEEGVEFAGDFLASGPPSAEQIRELDQQFVELQANLALYKVEVPA